MALTDFVLPTIGLALALVSCQSMPMFVRNDVNQLYQPAGQFNHEQPASRFWPLGRATERTANSPALDTKQAFLEPVSRAWSSPTNWGGSWDSNPQCSCLVNEGQDCFVLGSDGTVYYRSNHYGRFIDWQKIPGATAKSAPAVAPQRDGTIDVVIQGTDNVLYYSRRDTAGTWQAFETLNFVSHHRPAVAQWYSRALFIFAIGTDNQMYKLEHRHYVWWLGKTPNDWVSLGGLWSGGAVGAYLGGGAITTDVWVLAYDMNNDLQYTKFHITSADAKLANWVGSWTALGIKGTLPPAVSVRSNGYDVIVRTGTADLFINSYNQDSGNWLGWSSLGFRSDIVPAAASYSTGILHVFAVDDHHQMHTCSRRSQTGSFSSWEPMTGVWTSSPSAFIKSSAYVDVFALDENKALVCQESPM